MTTHRKGPFTVQFHDKVLDVWSSTGHCLEYATNALDLRDDLPGENRVVDREGRVTEWDHDYE